MGLRVGILADDLSGATAVASEFARAPMATFVTDRLTVEEASRLRADVVAINTRTRYAPPTDARRVIESVAHGLRKAQPSVVIKKIDSMLRGPMGAEIDAVFEAFGFAKCVLVAAVPSQGRTTVDALQMSNGRPIAELMGQEDPSCRPQSSHIPTVLARGSSRAIGCIGLQAVREGPDRVRSEVVACEAPLLVADCESDADMVNIIRGAWSADVRFFAGTYGMGAALMPLLREEGQGRPVLVVAGSMSATTRAQVEHLLHAREARHVPLHAGLALEGADATAVIAACRTAVSDALAANGVAVVTTAHDPEDDARLRRLGRERGWSERDVAYQVEKLLCAALKEVVPLASAVIATGGSTGEALLEALGAHTLEVQPLEALAGSPVARVRGGGLDGLRYLTKPGSFGGRDGLERMVSFLLQTS